MRDELEALLRLGARVHIRVQLARQPAVRLLDLVGAGVSLDAEDFVVVGHVGLFLTSCRSLWRG
ncbi:hypothetical protein [Leifsonia xyli]|uniref:hypothetical protein n=1 Tax=Leifsonia xyli TaxID=1575 RepID=UPI003D66B8F6